MLVRGQGDKSAQVGGRGDPPPIFVENKPQPLCEWVNEECEMEKVSENKIEKKAHKKTKNIKN